MSEAGLKIESMDDLIEAAREAADAKHAKKLESTNRNSYALGDRYQVQSRSITHDILIDWLIANPGRGQMTRCAAEFGFTNAWLSTLVHSDAFQAKLRDRKEEVFETVIVPLRDKIVGVADRAVEKLGEELEETSDPRLLLDVADKMLHKLGYAPKVNAAPAGTGVVNNTQINNYAVSPGLLAAAREKAKKGDLPHADKPSALPSPEGVPGEQEDNMGETYTLPAPVSVQGEEESPRGEEARADI